jgi:hypothetical protein
MNQTTQAGGVLMQVLGPMNTFSAFFLSSVLVGAPAPRTESPAQRLPSREAMSCDGMGIDTYSWRRVPAPANADALLKLTDVDKFLPAGDPSRNRFWYGHKAGSFRFCRYLDCGPVIYEFAQVETTWTLFQTYTIHYCD